MPGGQSRGLVRASQLKGWDPTRIEGFGSIANFDKDPGNLPGAYVGRLPGGPKDSWPDGYDVELGALSFSEPAPFNAPKPRPSRNGG